MFLSSSQQLFPILALPITHIGCFGAPSAPMHCYGSAAVGQSLVLPLHHGGFFAPRPFICLLKEL